MTALDSQGLDLTGRIESLISAITGSSVATVDGDWREAGLDSLDLLRLITTVEDEFATSIPDSALMDLRGPRELVAYLTAER